MSNGFEVKCNKCGEIMDVVHGNESDEGSIEFDISQDWFDKKVKGITIECMNDECGNEVYLNY